MESAHPFSSGEMCSWIRRIVSFGLRRPGYPQGLEVERFLESCFREFGLEEVRREPVPVQYWEPMRTVLSFSATAVDVPCSAIPYTAWTPVEGIKAPTVYLGEGGKADFEAVDLAGKIAVVDARFGALSAAALRSGAHFVHDPGQTIPQGTLHPANWLITNFSAYHEAHRRGAGAFIGLLVDAPVDGPDYYVPYDGYLKGLPGSWVGRESGDAVRELARTGAGARLVSLGKCEEVDSHNVVGVAPGRTDEYLLLTCHHDAPFASAVEDGSGLAVLLALAEACRDGRLELERNLLFVASSGHFHGGIGNRVFVEKHRDGLLARTVAAFGVEHIAEEAESDGHGGYRLTGLPEVRALFMDRNPTLLGIVEELTRRWDLDRTMAVDAYLFGPEPPCDSAPFFTAGIPSVCHISGPLYLFDPHDTLDKVRVGDLPRVASLFADLLRRVDGIPALELEEGLQRRRGDPPPPPPPWFLPPEAHHVG